MREKASKDRFLKPDKGSTSSKITLTKEKQWRKRKREEEERRRREKSNGFTRSFYNGYFGDSSWPKKNCWTEETVHLAITFSKIRLDYFLFYSFVTSSLPCRKDQFAVLYFLQVIIILIQVYNQEIRRHSMVCYCGLAGIYSTAIRPGFETVSKQHSAYAQQTSYSIKYRLFLESAKIEQGKERIC